MAQLFWRDWTVYLPDAAALALGLLLLLPRWRRQGRGRAALCTVFYLYLAGVLWVTVLPVLALLSGATLHYVPMVLQPFRDLRLGDGDAVRQAVLNVVMTVPFGVLYPLVRQRRGFFTTVGAALALSFAIELLQPLLPTARTADITDVICNTLGGALGWGFLRLWGVPPQKDT